MLSTEAAIWRCLRQRLFEIKKYIKDVYNNAHEKLMHLSVKEPTINDRKYQNLT